MSDWSIRTNENDPDQFYLEFRGYRIIQGFRDKDTNQMCIVMCDHDNLAHGGYFLVPYPQGNRRDSDEFGDSADRIWICYRLVGAPDRQSKAEEKK